VRVSEVPQAGQRGSDRAKTRVGRAEHPGRAGGSVVAQPRTSRHIATNQRSCRIARTANA
jgi:hypothetical protein